MKSSKHGFPDSGGLRSQITQMIDSQGHKPLRLEDFKDMYMKPDNVYDTELVRVIKEHNNSLVREFCSEHLHRLPSYDEKDKAAPVYELMQFWEIFKEGCENRSIMSNSEFRSLLTIQKKKAQIVFNKFKSMDTQDKIKLGLFLPTTAYQFLGSYATLHNIVKRAHIFEDTSDPIIWRERALKIGSVNPNKPLDLTSMSEYVSVLNQHLYECND